MHEIAEELTQAISDMDEEKLLQLAILNKSKKDAFSFKDVVSALSVKAIDEMCEQLKLLIIKHCEIMFIDRNDGSKNSKIMYESSRILQAVIDIAQVILDENLPISVAFLHMIVYLNGILLDFPAILESLQNRVAQLCEKMFHMNYVNQDQYFTFNALIYLLKRTLKPKATRTDLSRIYALRALIPKILTMDNINQEDIWELFRKIAVSSLYNSTQKGRVILSLILALDPHHVPEIHYAIKRKLPSCTKSQAEHYGMAYYKAWAYSINVEYETLTNELEISCIQDFVIMTIFSKRKHIVFVLRKLLAVIHAHKKEAFVSKMLYALFQPVLWMYLKHPNGLCRAHAAALFFDMFPLEDPESKIVTADQELNEQFLLIQDLLMDEYPIVRTTSVKGLCINMSANWELFPEDVLKNYFRIITNELSHDSSSVEVRAAVVKGVMALLENVLTVPTMKTVLPKLKHLFHDTSDIVRVAFCQLLLRIKKISAIKYFEVVPLEDLLARLEEDTATRKLIISLIYNSYLPKDTPVGSQILRSVNIIKQGQRSYRIFFQHVTHFHSLSSVVKFICKAIHCIHLFVIKTVKLEGNKSPELIAKKKKTKKESFEDQDSSDVSFYKLGLACEFGDETVVGGFMEAIVVMWLTCLNDLKKSENKKLLKQAVGEISKSLSDLIYYYKNSKVFPVVSYLGSLMTHERIPCLGSFCFHYLQNELDEDTDPLDYQHVLMCLCNQSLDRELLLLLREWIEGAFLQSTFPPPKRVKKRKGRLKEEAVASKHKLAVKLLIFLITEHYCQKILFSHSEKELCSFLDLFDPLKKRIESYQLKYISEEELEFINGLLRIFLKIAAILNQENLECNNIQFLDDVVTWAQNTLCSLAWPSNGLCSETWSSKNQNRASCTFQKLCVSLCKNLCTIIADYMKLGFCRLNYCKYMRFAMKLIETEDGPSLILEVSKLMYSFIVSGLHASSAEKDDKISLLVPDCFRKLLPCLCDDDFVNALPTDSVRELQNTLSVSLSVMYHYGVLKLVMSIVMLCFAKSILSCIKKTVAESWFAIVKNGEPFSELKISKSSSFLISIIFHRPKILAYFLRQLDKHLSKLESDPQTWISCYVLLFQVTEVKNVSRNLKKEIICLICWLEKVLTELYPVHSDQLRTAELPHTRSLPELFEELVVTIDVERPKQSFNIHCHLELKRLKALLKEKL